jgi:hypothetical protein
VKTLHGEDWARDDLGHGNFALDRDGQCAAFANDIRDALISQGVLYKDDQDIWRLRWTSFDLRAHEKAWMATCDFCSTRPVTWNIPCESFELPSVIVNDINTGAQLSRGDWAACETCGSLIARIRRTELLRHCVARQRERLASHAPHQNTMAFRLAARLTLKEIHRTFWAHYQGGAERIPPSSRTVAT